MKVVVCRQIKGTRCFLCPPCVPSWSFIDDQHVNMNVALCLSAPSEFGTRSRTWAEETTELLAEAAAGTDVFIWGDVEHRASSRETSPHVNLSGSERSTSGAASSVKERHSARPFSALHACEQLRKCPLNKPSPVSDSEEQKAPVSLCVCVCFKLKVLMRCSCWPLGCGCCWALLAAPACHSGVLRRTLRALSAHFLPSPLTDSRNTHSHTPKHTGDVTKWSRCDWRGLYWWCQLGHLVRLFVFSGVGPEACVVIIIVRTGPVEWSADVGSDRLFWRFVPSFITTRLPVLKPDSLRRFEELEPTKQHPLVEHFKHFNVYSRELQSN